MITPQSVSHRALNYKGETIEKQNAGMEFW
jgi:hypothetical protein